MDRTHKITELSTVRSQTQLPMNNDMTLEQLADLQMKQAKTHKTAMEGWDPVSRDMYNKNQQSKV